jgi:hypothetical protein
MKTHELYHLIAYITLASMTALSEKNLEAMNQATTWY